MTVPESIRLEEIDGQLSELEKARAAVFKKLLPDPSNEAYLHSRRDILLRITDLKRERQAIKGYEGAKPQMNTYRIPLKLK